MPATETKKNAKLPVPPPRVNFRKPAEPPPDESYYEPSEPSPFTTVRTAAALHFGATSLRIAINEKLITKNWTQRELAQVLGITPAAVSELMREDKMLAPEMAHRLASAFEDTSALDWMMISTLYHLKLTSPDRSRPPVNLATPARKPLAKARSAPKSKKAATPKAKAKNEPTPTRTPKKAHAKLDSLEATTRRDTIIALLERPGGCINREVRAAIGWKTISVPQQCRALGIKFRQEKTKGDPIRYFAR
jgi:plasmid maintenance system antidote protein VapI